jgi:hypothetical protein
MKMRHHPHIIGINRLAASLALAVALAACSGNKEEKVEANIFPANYKDEVLRMMPQILEDSEQIRDTGITEPALTTGRTQVYFVCVRMNSRDFNKKYTGIKDRIGYFFGGQLNQFVEATPEQCGRAAYKPFPELEKLCFRGKCT